MVNQRLKNALKDMEEIFFDKIEMKFMGKHGRNSLNGNVPPEIAGGNLPVRSKHNTVFGWFGSFFK